MARKPALWPESRLTPAYAGLYTSRKRQKPAYAGLRRLGQKSRLLSGQSRLPSPAPRAGFLLAKSRLLSAKRGRLWPGKSRPKPAKAGSFFPLGATEGAGRSRLQPAPGRSRLLRPEKPASLAKEGAGSRRLRRLLPCRAQRFCDGGKAASFACRQRHIYVVGGAGFESRLRCSTLYLSVAPNGNGKEPDPALFRVSWDGKVTEKPAFRFPARKMAKWGPR